MKKLLIIATLILSPLTYGTVEIVKTAGSHTKWVCKDLRLKEGAQETVDECIEKFIDLELNEQNPQHLEMIVKAEENLINEFGPYICWLRNGKVQEDLHEVKVELLSPISFVSSVETSAYYGNGIDWSVIATAKLKCILP